MRLLSMASGASSNDDDVLARRIGRNRTSSVATMPLAPIEGSAAAQEVSLALIQAPQPKRDHRKFDRERPRQYLDWNDFQTYMEDAFEGDRPEIIDDLIKYLTGIDLKSAKQFIREEDEFKTMTV